MSFFTSATEFTGPPLNDEDVLQAESKLGYRLPEAYLELLRERNGGTPIRCCFPMAVATSWAPDHVAIDAILGVGGEWGIDGADGLGSADMIAEWGYPDVGVVICHTPSGGHDAVMLDYSRCGRGGEPSVVYIDEDRSVKLMAPSFESFLLRLAPC